MPKLPELLKGFKLVEGKKYDDHRLQSISGEEVPVTPYRHYEYHIYLEFTGSNNINSQEQLLDILEKELFTPRTIYTRYHNPYECKFTYLEVANTGNNGITIYAVAQSDRIFK